MNNLLEVRGLHKKYPAFMLSDVTFDVPDGYTTTPNNRVVSKSDASVREMEIRFNRTEKPPVMS
ncbi:MAG: hypothetical protein LBS84_01025 [Clostridiales bacterium]|jgi:hypothetical protein|nr:hypothetical protein [Clostridiales bacterium]